MAGRGRNILQALKEKKEKEERERSQSPSSVSRQPLPVEQPAQIPAPSQPAAGRGVGRGQLASLIASRLPAAAKPVSPPPPAVEEPGVQVLYYSDEKAARPIPKRVSPFEPAPETSTRQSPPPIQQVFKTI